MEDGPCELQVRMEEIRCRLSDIDLLSFSQILYLLKEMMIGYDALIDIFGVFDIRPEMVAVSVNYQWKVWMHEDFFRNTKEEPKGAIGEREFIYRILILSEKHCQSTSLSKIFFGEMKEYTYNNDCGFIHMLESIKEFIKVNKIFQVNKVTLPNDKNFNKDISNNISSSNNVSSNNLPSSKIKSATSLNATSCFGTASRAGGQKIGMDKKKSIMVNSSTDHFRPSINRTSGVPFPQMANNARQIINKKPESQL